MEEMLCLTDTLGTAGEEINNESSVGILLGSLPKTFISDVKIKGKPLWRVILKDLRQSHLLAPGASNICDAHKRCSQSQLDWITHTANGESKAEGLLRAIHPGANQRKEAGLKVVSSILKSLHQKRLSRQ